MSDIDSELSIFEKQRKFMHLGNQSTIKDWFDDENRVNYEQGELYLDLIREEVGELFEAIDGSEPLENVVKEACDVLVVVNGLLESYGVDVQSAWNIVLDNNLMKVTGLAGVDRNSGVVKDANGKIMKSAASIERKAKMMSDLRDLI